MDQKQGNSTLRILNKNYGSTSTDNLVQLNPYEDLGYYAHHYRECADRLAASHQGKPEDDEILMPFLTLYRQAYELLLKDLALCIASHQVRFGNSAANYSRANMKKLIGNGNWGHSLHKSFKWVSEEIAELRLSDESLPGELTLAVNLLHGMDPAGTKFRYPDPSLNQTLNIDIRKLQADLAAGIDWLWAVYDHTDETLSAAPSLSDYM